MIPSSDKYDFIIAGMGCAGLSLAVRLKQAGVPFSKVLLIDKSFKNENDRTWCFWTKEDNNWFDSLVTKSWDKFVFQSTGFKKECVLEPYRYQMIRGIDFYKYCLEELKQDARFEMITDEITALSSHSNYAVLRTKTQSFSAKYVFNSAFRTLNKKEKQVNYLQHFMGWIIETPENVFDDTCPVFMNFNTKQHNDCRFFYVLPYSKNKALIEYTGFSEKRISKEEYEHALKHYIEKDLSICSYTIVEQEQGEIPMTESEFINPFGNRVINIGIAGGNSKPSTGYTFYFIQQNTAHIIHQLLTNAEAPHTIPRKKRFLFYDRVLLQVLHEKKIPGSDVFTALFRKIPVAELLAFLNDESNWYKEIKILNAVPKNYFIPSALKKLF